MTIKHKLLRCTATLVRKAPWLLVVPYVTYRFFRPRYSLGVVGVIMNDAGEILLVEHVFHARDPWGLPGGWVDRNEDPADAVLREIKEELQLTVTIEKLLLMAVTERNHLDIAFLCRQVDNIGTLSSELLDYRWFDPPDLPVMTKFHTRAINRALEPELSQ
jgi:8-oxo-dGTP diphosphatase